LYSKLEMILFQLKFSYLFILFYFLMRKDERS
jgi:hypothetical protein